MLCVRCSHPLSPHADRCVRCFALNPPRGAPRPSFDVSSDPPARGGLSIESNPAKPVAFSFDSEPPESGTLRAPRTEPAPFVARAPAPAAFVARAPANAPPYGLRPSPAKPSPPTEPFARPRNLPLPFPPAVSEPVFPAPKRAAPVISTPIAPAISSPEVDDEELDIVEEPEVAAPVRSEPEVRGAVRASGASRLMAWAVDSALLSALVAAQVLLTARFTGHDWLDLALSRPLLPFWMVLTACDALACSWLFAAMGRTPGMALLGQRLRTLDGEAPTPGEALKRALLSLLSAAPALFGFSFALFDSRCQTLHDKLTGCIVTVD
jgi:uncharacterized RDD family membrane protein YckC